MHAVLGRGERAAVDQLDAIAVGIGHERDPRQLGPICFVQDPDGYRIELIDGGAFETPQDW